MTKLLLGLSFLLVLNSCQTVFRPWLLSELSTGMNLEQVREKLGEPASIISNEATTVLVYSYTEPTKLQSEFSNWGNSLSSHSYLQPVMSIKQYQYELIFVDNALINYKEKR